MPAAKSEANIYYNWVSDCGSKKSAGRVLWECEANELMESSSYWMKRTHTRAINAYAFPY